MFPTSHSVEFDFVSLRIYDYKEELVQNPSTSARRHFTRMKNVPQFLLELERILLKFSSVFQSTLLSVSIKIASFLFVLLKKHHVDKQQSVSGNVAPSDRRLPM